MEKNDGRTFEDGDRKQKFVLNMLTEMSVIHLAGGDKGGRIQIWPSEKWSGPEMYTGFTNES